jgi:hypothetical protein
MNFVADLLWLNLPNVRDFSFYFDSQISVRRSLKNRSIDNLETQKKYISMKIPNSLIIYSM